MEGAPKGFLGVKPDLSVTGPMRGAQEKMGKALLAEAENKQSGGLGWVSASLRAGGRAWA